MARPLKKDEKKRPNHLGFRVTDAVRDALHAEADRKGIPMSDIVHDLLEKAFLGRGEKKT